MLTDKMEFGHGLNNADISKDKGLKRILKQVENIKRMKKGDTRSQKMGEFVHVVLGQMKKRRSDNLLQSTAIWALLTLVSLDKYDTIQVMLKAGVSTVLYDMIKFEQLAPPTKKYASDLISLLCSGGLGDFEDVSVDDEQSSVLKRQFMETGSVQNSVIGELTVDDMSSVDHTYASGLQSFAPYHIDDDNVKLMNSLFDENALWRDINDTNANMHKIAYSLDGSLDGGGSSVANLSHANSSTSDFWDSLYQRYDHPAPYRAPSSSSMTRQRLESAVRQSQGGHSATIPSRTPNGRKSKTAAEMFPSLEKRRPIKPPFQLTNDLPVNSTSDYVSVDTMQSEAIVPNYLTRLDPLSINITTTLRSLAKNHAEEEAGDDSTAVSFLNDGRHVDEGFSMGSSIDTLDDDQGEGINNVFFRPKSNTIRTRIKAEKLHDMKFIRRMFKEKHMTIKDTQDLIAKLEDILELMDKENTGYVTWKVFSRVLVSISPKHLLRADVEAFLSAQVDNEEDLIDYKEFTISGKVMVVENKEGVHQILARSWYSRQTKNRMLALGDNDPTSTYTWKNHVKWFKKRKSDALIWLMRRANRAIKYYSYVENAQSYLFQVGVFGKALTGLIDSGTRALEALDKNRNIRIALSKRAIHARDYRRKRDEARQFLFYKSHPEVLTPQEEKRKEVLRIQKKKEEHYHKAFSPSIHKVYRLIYVTKEATEFLKETARIAQEKCRKQDLAFEWLSRLGKQIIRQEIRHIETQQELYAVGEKSRHYCVHIDKAILGLMRWGEFALSFFDRQVAALQFLLERAHRAQEFTIMKENVTAQLLHCGQRTLQKLNIREEGFAFLSKRALLSQDLRRNQAAAIKFLRRIPERIYENEKFLENANAFLLEKAKHALKHEENTHRAVKYLMTVASRSVAVSRRRNMAQADLKQIGNKAQRSYFEKLWVPLPGNKDRLRDEIKRINTHDKRIKALRKSLTEEERWKAELMDAFSSLANAFSVHESKIGGVGTSGFKKSSSSVGNLDRPPSSGKVARAPSSGKLELDRPSSSEKFDRPSTSDKLDRQSSSGKLDKQGSVGNIGKKQSSFLGSLMKKPSMSSIGGSDGNLDLGENFDDSLEIGRLGFKQLIKDGKMLGLQKGTADACYETVDSDGSGAVSFSEVWKWFRYNARMRTRQKPGSVVVHHPNIIPAKDRAIVALMKRFARQPVGPATKKRPSTADDIDVYG